MVNMKKIFKMTAVLAILTGLLAGCGGKKEETTTEAAATEAKSAAPTELVISTWGYNEDKLRENLFGPFEKANNVKIILETGNNSDRLNKIRTLDSTKVDLIFLAEAFAVQGINEGLFEEINRENIPNVKDIYEMAQAPNGEKFGPAYTLNRTGIIYDTASVDMEVSSWADLWNAEFESNAAIPEITTTAGPSMVITAGNLAGSNVFADSSAAFEKLVELKPNLVKTYGRSSELANMFTQGEIVIGVAQDFAYGRIKGALPTAKWVNPKEGSFANLNTINIVKGSKNKELAEKFINWALSEELQKANALSKIDSPVNVKVELSAEEAEGLTYGKELIESLKGTDTMKVNEVLTQWIDKWNREVSN